MISAALSRLARPFGHPLVLVGLLIVLGLAGSWVVVREAVHQSNQAFRQQTASLLDHGLLHLRDTLSASAAEYAVWNDMYAATLGPAPDFRWLRENFNGSIQRNLKIQLGLVVDAEGRDCTRYMMAQSLNIRRSCCGSRRCNGRHCSAWHAGTMLWARTAFRPH